MRLPINCFAIRRQILFVTVYLQHNHNSKVVYETHYYAEDSFESHESGMDVRRKWHTVIRRWGGGYSNLAKWPEISSLHGLTSNFYLLMSVNTSIAVA